MEYMGLILLIILALCTLSIFRFNNLEFSVDFSKLKLALSGKRKAELDSESATLLDLLGELGYSNREKRKLEGKFGALKEHVKQLEQKYKDAVGKAETTKTKNPGILVASDEEDAIKLGGGSYSRALQALADNRLWDAVACLEYIYNKIKDVEDSEGAQRRILKLIANNLYMNGQYTAAAEFIPKMKEVQDEDWETSNLIGIIYKTLGNFELSESAFHDALKSADSPRSRSVARATVENNLGNLLVEVGDPSGGRLWLESSLDKLRTLRPLERDKYIATLDNLGTACTYLKDFSSAEKRYRQALEEYDADNLEDAKGYATTLNNLALLYSHSGREQEAVELFKRSLTVMERAGRHGHPNFASTALNLSDLLWFLGEFDDAEEMLDLGLERLGEVHLEAKRERIAQLEFKVRGRIPSTRNVQ